MVVGSLLLECKLGRRLYLTSAVADDCFVVNDALVTATTPQRFVDALPQSTRMSIAKVAVVDAWIDGVCVHKNDYECLAGDDKLDTVDFLILKTEPLTMSMFQVNNPSDVLRFHVDQQQQCWSSTYVPLDDLIVDKAVSPTKLVELYCQHKLKYADKQENDV